MDSRWILWGMALVLSGCLSTGGGGGNGNAANSGPQNSAGPGRNRGVGAAPTALTAGTGPRHGSLKRRGSPSARSRPSPALRVAPVPGRVPDPFLTPDQQDRLNELLRELRLNTAFTIQEKQEILRGVFQCLKEAKRKGEPIDDGSFKSAIEQGYEAIEALKAEPTRLTGGEDTGKGDATEFVRAGSDGEEADDTPVKEINRARAFR